MTNPTQHDPRAVEAMAKALWKEYDGATGDDLPWDELGNEPMAGMRAEARFVLTREAALVEALERIADTGVAHICEPVCGCYSGIARAALRAHRASRLPSEPTLEQAVADARAASNTVGTLVAIPHDKWLRVERALDLARERERGK